jgi:hypothetical protein
MYNNCLRKDLEIIIFSIVVFFLIVGLDFNYVAADEKVKSSKDASENLPTPITIEGTVLKYIPNGIIINRGDVREIVLGLGPDRYWDAAQCEKPQAGEFVKVKALDYEISGQSLLIFQSISYDNKTITLRDPSDGHPLWREK